MKKLLTLVLSLFLLFSCEPSTDRYCRFINDFSVVAKNRITDISLSAQDTIYAGQYAILLSVDAHTFKCQDGEVESYSPTTVQYNFDTIMALSITSDKDFNSSAPAGSELSQYFSMPDADWYKSVHSNTTIQDVKLNLIQAPEWSGIHTFKVAILISSKEEMVHSVLPVVLKK